jgi:Protein of unknown function (DUF3311)
MTSRMPQQPHAGADRARVARPGIDDPVARRPVEGRRPRLTQPEPPRPLSLRPTVLPTRDRPSAWHALLVIPVLAPLFTPFYNRLEPRLYGIPFFYWGQLACVLLAMVVTTLVYQLTKRRG